MQRALGKDVDEPADKLSILLMKANKQKWSSGGSSDWAKESYEIAKKKVRRWFGNPDIRSGPSKVFRVDAEYDKRGVAVVKEQLAKAGVRLAGLLREALE